MGFFNKKKQPAQPTAQAEPRAVEPKQKKHFFDFFWEEFDHSRKDSNGGVLFPYSIWVNKGTKAKWKWEDKIDKLEEKIRKEYDIHKSLSSADMVIYMSVFKTISDSIYVYDDGTIIMKDTYRDWIEIQEIQRVEYDSNHEWYIKGEKGSGYVKEFNSKAVPYLKRLAKCVEAYVNQ